MEDKTQCNISGNEVKLRLYTGYFGLVFSVIILIFVLMFNLSSLAIFPFIFISALGFIQARERYCVYVGIIDLIKNPVEHKKEILHILRSIIISLFIAGIGVVGLYLLTLSL